MPRRDDTAVMDFMTQRVNAIPTEEAPLIAGTEAVPEDIASAIGDLVKTSVEKKKKEKWLTIYDRFDRPSKVSSDRLMMTLTEKDNNGEPWFFAQRRGVHLDIVSVRCPRCGKTIAENPDLEPPQRPVDDEERQWREDILLFPHMWKRHSSAIPRHFRDKERRAELQAFTTGPGK